MQTVLVVRLHVAVAGGTEEVEVVNLVSHADDPVLAYGLIDLHTRHAEVDDSCLPVFQFRREVVLECHVDTEQRRECLVDAHLTDVVHRTWYWCSRRYVLDESETVHILLPCGVALV